MAEDQSPARKRQLTLRTLMLVVLILALALGWWVDHRRLKRQIPPPSAHELPILVFPLENGKASELAPAIQALFPRDRVYITSDARTNAVIVRGPKDRVTELEAILLRLESEE